MTRISGDARKSGKKPSGGASTKYDVCPFLIYNVIGMTNRPVFHSRFFIIMLAKPVCLLAYPFLEQFGMIVSSVADPYPTIKSYKKK